MKQSEMVFLKQFHHNFGLLKDLPMALYGIGQYTGLLVEHLPQYHFVGLMDANATGSIVYGLPVLDEAEVSKRAKVMIIVANLTVSPVIYQRIRDFTERAGIVVYYLNGTQPMKENTEFAGNPYWDKDRGRLERLIQEHDIISFDIFDTLMMRIYWKPEDLFRRMEDLLGREEVYRGYFANGRSFAVIRKQTEKSCYRNRTEFFTLEMIYEEIGRELSVPGGVLKEWKKLEETLEEKALLPRESMRDILRFARQCGKRILLTSDMYLEVPFIEKQLKRCGIVDYDKLLISCDVKCDKYKETIWDYIKELFPAQSVLHIGDNTLVDVEKPLGHGIDTWRVAKASEMLKWSGIYGYWNKENPGILGGLFVAQAMNDPFALSDSRGKLVIKNMYEMGYLFFGPLVLGFLCWLIKTARVQRIDTLLFAARDGYLLEKLFYKLSEFIEGTVPKGVYFLTSRRAASVAMIHSEEDIRFVIENVCNVAGVNMEELLRCTFGVQIKEAEEWKYKTVRELGKEKVIQYVLQHYQKCILESAKQERQAYLAYIESLSLSGKKGFVNFVCRGVSQYCMERLLHEPMTGLYFAGEELEDIFPNRDRIYAWYGTACSTHTSKEDLLAGYLFGEVIFSAPQGQLICFDHKGEAIFDDRECDFTGIAECHEGIERYMEDVIQRVPDFLNYEWDRKLIDRIFGSFYSPYVIFGDAVKKNFVFQDGITGKGMTLL